MFEWFTDKIIKHVIKLKKIIHFLHHFQVEQIPGRITRWLVCQTEEIFCNANVINTKLNFLALKYLTVVSLSGL